MIIFMKFRILSIGLLLVYSLLVGQEPESNPEGGGGDTTAPPDCTLVSMICNAKNKKEPGSDPPVCCLSAGGNRAGTCLAAKEGEERGFADSVLDEKRCGKQTAYEDGVCGNVELGPCAANRPKAGCVSQECPADGNL